MLICADEALQMAIELLHELSVVLAKSDSAAEMSRLPGDMTEGWRPDQHVCLLDRTKRTQDNSMQIVPRK